MNPQLQTSERRRLNVRCAPFHFKVQMPISVLTDKGTVWEYLYCQQLYLHLHAIRVV